MDKHRYIKTDRSGATVEQLCRLLEVSHSGYYAWLHGGDAKRTQQNQALRRVLVGLHEKCPALGLDSLHQMLKPKFHCVSISVGKMFQSGIILGILLGLALCIPTYIISVKRKYPRHEKTNWKQKWICTKDAIWAMLMPLILLGGILSGVFTPTEASIVTCVYALLIGVFVYKEIRLKEVPSIVWKNIRACASIIVLIGLANVFAYILTAERIPQAVANAILSVTDNKIVIILLINLVLLFVGMFMESLAAILITFPVLLPVAIAIRMDPVHFALMAILNLMLGLTTPPVGMCVHRCTDCKNFGLPGI